MRDAPVGFHCPTCVAEAVKSTRSGRTAYGGLRSANPQLTSLVLVVINAAVWLLIIASGGANSTLVDRLSLWREDVTLATTTGGLVHIHGVADGAWWQLITSAFTHVSAIHIAFNMLALWVLGPQLEAAIGRTRFLALYLGSALAGSTLVYWFVPINTYTLGASGAIFGLMAALLVLAHKVGGNYQQILLWIGLNALITVVGRGFISWQGHLGGFVGGLLLAVVIVYAPRNKRLWWQVGGMSVVGVVLAILLLARTLQLA